MSHPSLLHIISVQCTTTEDWTGNDDLYGKLGTHTFRIGSFSADSRVVPVDKEIVIPRGVTILGVFEDDELDPDDHIGDVDLTIDMDQPRTVELNNDGANYAIVLQVASEADA